MHNVPTTTVGEGKKEGGRSEGETEKPCKMCASEGVTSKERSLR